MQKRTLYFPSILELIDFEMVCLQVPNYEVNRNNKSITAEFSSSEIAEAVLTHKAFVEEENSNGMSLQNSGNTYSL